MMFRRIALCTMLLGLGFAVTAQATPVLILDPATGVLSGTPGSTVGWGFTLTNTTGYLLVTSADFVTTSPGTFTDFISLNFTVVGPSPDNSTWSQIFNEVANTGVGSFAIDLDAPFETMFGEIVISYDLFSVSPNDASFDSVKDTLSSGNLFTAPASVTVVSASAVPEPSTLLLLAGGLVGMCLYRRKAAR